jgi:hypothetical protein
LAGYLSYRLHNRGDAETYYGHTDTLAAEAGDDSLRAMGLIARSALYSSIPYGGQGGDPLAALALLDEAEAIGRSPALPYLETWLCARRVEDYATIGDARESDQSLEYAERSFAKIRGRDDGFFNNWTSGRLAAYRGNAAVLLRRAPEAAQAAEEALKHTGASLAGERCFLMIVLGAAHAEQGLPDAACAWLGDSLDLASRSGLTERIQRIKGIRRQYLVRWPTAPSVRQLDEQLRLVGH